eukprot:352980-Chlamydomonas_euryale.AAC.1
MVVRVRVEDRPEERGWMEVWGKGHTWMEVWVRTGQGAHVDGGVGKNKGKGHTWMEVWVRTRARGTRGCVAAGRKGPRVSMQSPEPRCNPCPIAASIHP